MAKRSTRFFVAGSYDKLQRILAGEDWEKVINGDADPLYRLKRVGDTMSAMDELSRGMITGLLGRAESSKAKGADLLRDLWINPGGFDRHVVKRVTLGHAEDAGDYASKTFGAIADASKLVIATPADNDGLVSGKISAVTDKWVVIFSEDGRIVTSYPFDPNKVTFEERHRQRGDSIREYTISREISLLFA